MKVAVFGAGTMGSGIAQVFAAKGHTALMYASSTASAQRHKDKLAASLNKKVAKGKMTQEAADDIMSRVLVEEFEGAADADLVIECVAENMEVKKELLGRLDALCKDETIFASNTSSLSITEMGQGLKHNLIGISSSNMRRSRHHNPEPTTPFTTKHAGRLTTSGVFLIKTLWHASVFPTS